MTIATLDPQTPAATVTVTTTMKAVVQERYGAADVLAMRDVDLPAVADGDVRVSVRAASVNVADWRFMRGSPYLLRLAAGLRAPKNPVRGIDVAGIVESVGKDVTRFRPGDEVVGWCEGAYAEYTSAAEDHFVTKPVGMTFDEAASVPLAAMTALQGLRDKGRLQPGQRVLIVGASGGVGTFAVQIAKALGAEVTGVCSTKNVHMVRAIGADHVIDYTSEDFASGEQRYDIIFQLAGTRSPSDCRRALSPDGTLVLCSGDGRFSGMGRQLAAMVSSPFVGQRLVSWVSKQKNADLQTLATLIEDGQITPVIDRTYPLSEVPAAISYVEAGHTRGKVVISVPAHA